jgi:hypothetical protein
MTSGYSGKSLADKLGLKGDDNVCVINALANYDELIGHWPMGASVTREHLNEIFSFIHYFASERAKLVADLSQLAEHLEKTGMLWVSWPKASSGVATDVNENVLREVILPTGLVDVKVAAIDETWSGLKFVWRKEKR